MRFSPLPDGGRRKTSSGMVTGERSRFGALLRQHRLAVGLTQGELARRAQLSLRGISDLERGINQTPRQSTVRLLATALELSAQDYAAFEAAARRSGTPPAPAPEPSPAAVAPSVAPPFVNRAREWAVLQRHYGAEGVGSAPGGGAVPLLLLAGEPGIGKTRLLHEAAGDAAARGWTVLRGGCQRRGRGPAQGEVEPYAPFLEALEHYLARCSPAQLRAALRGCAWLVRLLPELAGNAIEPLPGVALPPEQERRLTFNAVARFLANVAGQDSHSASSLASGTLPIGRGGGTLLVLDDLQWAGVDALDLLTALARSAASAQGAGSLPLRMIGAYRDTEIRPDDPLAVTLADLGHAGLAVQRTLDPLARDEAAALLDALLAGLDDTGQAVREQVLQRAGGVPFFLVSCAQGVRASLLDGGSIRGDVPWDLAQSVRQRMAALTEPAQELLRVAAVAGREASRALLVTAAGCPEPVVLAALAEACRVRLLVEVGDTAYRFAHDVIREVVEADVGAAGRATMHGRIAQALEASLPGEAGERSAEAIAYHYACAGDHARAAHWLERAGDRAAAGFANAAALADYEAAHEHLAASGAAAGDLSRLDEKIGDAHLRIGAFAEARDAFARARAGASEPARRAELGRKEGVCWEKQGKYARALAAFDLAADEGASDRGQRALPIPVQAALELSRGEVLYAQGEYAEAEQAAERARALLGGERTGRDADLALARVAYLQGRVAWGRGDLARAEDCHRRSLALRERAGDLAGIAECWHNLGHVAYDRANLAAAEERFRRSLALRERIGDQEGIAACWNNLGNVARESGDPAEAEACYRRSLDAHAQLGDQEGVALAWHNLGIVAVNAGNLAQGEECFRRSLAIKERTGNQWGIALSCAGLGEVSLLRGDLAAAEEYHQRSRAIGERIGDRWGLAYVWINLGEVAVARGDLAIAAARYRLARRLARAIATPDAEAYAALGQASALLAAATTLPPGDRRICSRLRAVTVLLERGRSLAAAHGLVRPAVYAALIGAELRLYRRELPAARAAAEEALQGALVGRFHLEEARARRLLGQWARLAGASDQAEHHLRTALDRLAAMGAALELARTRLELVATLAGRAPTGAANGGMPTEAR